MKLLPWKQAEKLINGNKSNNLLFLAFTVQWCGDCKMMKPVISRIASKYESFKQITFVEVDAEEANLLRDPNTKWEVLKVPTFILLKGTEIVEKGYEYIPEEILIDWIEKRINSTY
ncbi:MULTISPECIES: thioredoxin family protein [unclassified Mycoplasma]|uniref:thioredoxin family protein n=1 Tax=unclassified Mycoplasma TaxID=2683645 RepID=UPI00211C7569|nr:MULTISPECIES: thioredoxin family protein [unclassified Mycoplasma]UUM19954.1 thioredoxin family protein [Mycoplasma sp. 1578d]UUM24935.1 thioredoxin family protein [Mycoplasma sp. 3686d]